MEQAKNKGPSSAALQKPFEASSLQGTAFANLQNMKISNSGALISLEER